MSSMARKVKDTEGRDTTTVLNDFKGENDIQ